jgi:transposase
MEKILSSQASNWREGRRLRAFELKEQGWKQKEIAEALGVSEGAVSQWMKLAREQEVEGLRHKPPPGATPRLSEEQRAKVPELLDRGAEAHGFRGELWTCDRVAISDPQRVWGQLPPGSCELFAEGSEAKLAKTAVPG